MPRPAVDQLEFTDAVQLTGNSTIERLRLAVSPPGKKSLWLKDLSDAQLAEVWVRLKNGQALDHVTRIVGEKWKVRQDLKKRSMSLGLKVFRERVLSETDYRKDKAAKPLDKEGLKERKFVSKERQRLKESFDLIEEWMQDIQDYREHLQLIKQQETKLNLPIKNYGKDFDKLTTAYKELAAVMLRIGLLDSKPSEHNLNLKLGFDGTIGRLPDGGACMIDQAHRFITLVNESCVELECGPDGAFMLPEGLSDGTIKDAECVPARIKSSVDCRTSSGARKRFTKN
jgi:hypothetical protein